MFRQTQTAIVLLLLLTSLSISDCGLQQPNLTPLPPGSAASALGQTAQVVTTDACAEVGDVDSNGNGVCDRDEAALDLGPPGPDADPAAGSGSGGGDHDSPSFCKRNGELCPYSIGLGIIAAVTMACRSDAIQRLDCTWFNGANAKLDTELSFDGIKSYEEETLETQNIVGTSWATYFSKANFTGRLKWHKQEYGSKQGSQARLCIHGKLVVPQNGVTGFADGTAQALVQFQVHQKFSLDTPTYNKKTKIDFDNFCRLHEGAWVGFAKDMSESPIEVSSIAPMKLGWDVSTIPDVRVTKISTLALVKSDDGTKNVAQFRRNPSNPQTWGNKMPLNMSTMGGIFQLCESTNPKNEDQGKCKISDFLSINSAISAEPGLLKSASFKQGNDS